MEQQSAENLTIAPNLVLKIPFLLLPSHPALRSFSFSLHWLYPHLIDVRQISGLKMLPDKSDTEHTSDGVPYPNSFSIIHVSSIWQMEKEKAEMKLAAASPQWKSRENVSVSSRTAGSVLGT